MLDHELEALRERYRKLQYQIKAFQREERKLARAIQFEVRRRNAGKLAVKNLFGPAIAVRPKGKYDPKDWRVIRAGTKGDKPTSRPERALRENHAEFMRQFTRER